MCGIAGIIASKPGSVNRQELESMTQILAHRGPDGQACWINESGTVGLGHRRLSIIDLSHAGDQPMHYMDRYVIIFNGEIYNYIELKQDLLRDGYHFNSQSDTEVILALYDRDKQKLLEKLDGMFTIVIYDRKEDTVFCARDRFGEKPFFYYYEEGNKFCFASEMKALWNIGVSKSVNERMLFNYLSYGLLQNPVDLGETFYKDIRKLKAAHYFTLDVKQCRLLNEKKYWGLDNIKISSISINDACEKLEELFKTSVSRRLRSDVPVGSSLSGGIDSSLVVRTIDEIKGANQVQKTFSARFPGYIKDEGKYMQMVIDQCNLEPHFTYPDEKNTLENIEKVFYHQEEPFISASICAQFEVMKLAKANDIIVLLDGQGADETLAGYHFYFQDYFNELKSSDRERYKKEQEAYRALHDSNSINPVFKKGIKYFFRKHANGPFQLAKNIRDQYKSIFRPEFNRDFFKNYHAINFSTQRQFESLNDSLKWSTTKTGLEDLLRYADRNSMASSVEVRLPFLSHELVEFIFSLPSEYKIRDGWTKWLLRVSFEKHLPSQIAWRRDKIGYEPPQKDWMKNEQVKDLIYEKRKKLVAAGVLNKKVLTGEVLSEAAGERQNNSWAHWMAGNLYS